MFFIKGEIFIDLPFINLIFEMRKAGTTAERTEKNIKLYEKKYSR